MFTYCCNSKLVPENTVIEWNAQRIAFCEAERQPIRVWTGSGMVIGDTVKSPINSGFNVVGGMMFNAFCQVNLCLIQKMFLLNVQLSI